jgi:predicted kinase
MKESDNMALTLMCGLSFSGKSTLAARIATDLEAELISLDAINLERGLDGGQGIPLEEWAATNQIAHDRVGRLLSESREVVVDDTGSPRFIRDGWREIAEKAGSRFVLVWVQIDEELQRQRLYANRSEQSRHDIVDEVLAAHLAEFEAPIDEDPVTIDACDTRDATRVGEVVAAIRASK